MLSVLRLSVYYSIVINHSFYLLYKARQTLLNKLYWTDYTLRQIYKTIPTRPRPYLISKETSERPYGHSIADTNIEAKAALIIIAKTDNGKFLPNRVSRSTPAVLLD